MSELEERLRKLWEDQIKFNISVGQLDYKDRSSEEMLQVYLLGMMTEMSELLTKTNWKHHRKQNKPTVSGTDLADGLADIGKYALCLFQLFGYTPEMMLDCMQKKTDAMWHVLGSEFSQPAAGQSVILCDIDNTVARYVSGFSRWMGSQGFPPVTPAMGWKSYDMNGLFGLGWSEYQTLKLRWEQGEANGGYSTLDPYAAWVHAVRRAQKAGAYVILSTARPHDKAKQVWYDCWSWAVKHFGKVDRLLFADGTRVETLLEFKAKGHPVLWLDDQYLPMMHHYHLPCFVHSQPYNELVAKELNLQTFSHTGIQYEDIQETLDAQHSA